MTVVARKGAAGAATAACPLQDAKETVAQYARPVCLPETKTLDLGNGPALELVLIPADKSVKGAAELKPPDEEPLWGKIIASVALLAVGGGILLVPIGFAIRRAIRERRRFQYSLRPLPKKCIRVPRNSDNAGYLSLVQRPL